MALQFFLHWSFHVSQPIDGQTDQGTDKLINKLAIKKLIGLRARDLKRVPRLQKKKIYWMDEPTIL